KRIIDVAADLRAPAIIGSMQGRHAQGQRESALSTLADSLAALAEHAKGQNTHLLYEPLNRYETNVFVRQGDAADWVRARKLGNVKLLCDLFHMNIEETNVAESLRHVGDLLGHVHFVDSNRLAPGMGHTNFAPIIQALGELNYSGYVSAECFPDPNSETAARAASTA